MASKFDQIDERLTVKDGGTILIQEGGTFRAQESIILPSESGKGIKLTADNPDFGWKDLILDVNPKATGAGNPSQAAIMDGAIKSWAYAANDVLDMMFHLPHDYALGTDIYIHVHWFHTGTTISGSLVNQFTHTYAKGHDQAAFGAEKVRTLTVDAAFIGKTFDITGVPALQHRIDEIQLSAQTPDETQLDTDTLEPDGIILMRYSPTTIPTLGGGGKYFVPAIDLHYQSSQLATKNRAPNFYG